MEGQGHTSNRIVHGPGVWQVAVHLANRCQFLPRVWPRGGQVVAKASEAGSLFHGLD
ncbi:unnamed protein product [Penicillium roqueforti FM164]|uniref:Uncharacterized protein n=1 Tax=Penicillium roqueforti (strain FM164) TaxID=1365484 RepID=W6QNK3_PENRF|nr:unnamed protein product [Penicillium roqueforti FM164]